MGEHVIQAKIRGALAGVAHIFRANVGRGWTGSRVDRLPGGRVLIHDARPFDTGLPPGFSDLFGWTSITVTPDMVGKRLAVFAAVEVKTPSGRVRDNQSAFLRAVAESGGRAGVARSPEDALAIIRDCPE